jgi:hypothetical protein
MSENIRTGGCQCGAVRFRIRGKLGRASICHCRMCQKQFGGFFGPLVGAPEEGPDSGIEWTREKPSYFQSSVNIDRGFCARCGTPLTYRYPEGLEIAIGAFDDRSDLAPKIQVNTGSAIAWVWEIFDAPKRSLAEDEDRREEKIISFQHPDHEVPNWPAKGLKV